MPAIFHPMKGPMTTQSLRGMLNGGPMHWRGDRTGGNDAPSAQPDSGAFDERAAFAKFQGGFTDLLGRDAPIPAEPTWTRSPTSSSRWCIRRTPTGRSTTRSRPIRRPDVSCSRTPTAACRPRTGPDHVLRCASCHTLDPAGNPDTARPGFFGTSGHVGHRRQPAAVQGPPAPQPLSEDRHVRKPGQPGDHRGRQPASTATRSAASGSSTTATSTPCSGSTTRSSSRRTSPARATAGCPTAPRASASGARSRRSSMRSRPTSRRSSASRSR